MSLDHVTSVLMRYIKDETYDKGDILSEFNEDIRQKDDERNQILEELEKVSELECEEDSTIEGEIRAIQDYNINEYLIADSFEHSLKVFY